MIDPVADGGTWSNPSRASDRQSMYIKCSAASGLSETYHEIHILSLGNPLKFHSQLIQFPNFNHGFISPSSHDMFPIFRRLYLHRTSRERKILNQFKRSELMLRLDPLALSLGITGGFGLDGYP